MPYGMNAELVELLAAPLDRVDEADGLAVERRVRRGRAGAQMRLQRDVSEILEREHPEVVGMAEDLRHRHRHRRKQVVHVDERERRVLERRRVHREHERLALPRQDPEVPPIGRIAGQGDNTWVGHAVTRQVARHGAGTWRGHRGSVIQVRQVRLVRQVPGTNWRGPSSFAKRVSQRQRVPRTRRTRRTGRTCRTTRSTRSVPPRSFLSCRESRHPWRPGPAAAPHRSRGNPSARARLS